MDRLKLVALDTDDLSVISAHCQDAVLRADDIKYYPAEKRLVIALRRFVWDSARPMARERRLAVLDLERATAVRTLGIDRRKGDQALALLAILFKPGDAPSGEIEFVFSGHCGLRVAVECVEARLADMDASWEAQSRPSHES
jgi:hypothetical protein